MANEYSVEDLSLLLQKIKELKEVPEKVDPKYVIYGDEKLQSIVLPPGMSLENAIEELILIKSHTNTCKTIKQPLYLLKIKTKCNANKQNKVSYSLR